MRRRDTAGKKRCNTSKALAPPTCTSCRSLLRPRKIERVTHSGETFSLGLPLPRVIGVSTSGKTASSTHGTLRVQQLGPQSQTEHVHSSFGGTVHWGRLLGGERQPRREHAQWTPWHHPGTLTGAPLIRSMGGRGTIWQKWCPSPLPSELQAWPEGVVADLHHHYLDQARRHLDVQVPDLQGDHPLVHTLLEALQSTPFWDKKVLAAPMARRQYVPATRKLQVWNPQETHTAPALVALHTQVQRLHLHEGRIQAITTSQGTLPLKPHAQVFSALGTLENTRLVLQLNGEETSVPAAGHVISKVSLEIPQSALSCSPATGWVPLILRFTSHERHFHLQVSLTASAQDQTWMLHLAGLCEMTGGSTRFAPDPQNPSLLMGTLQATPAPPDDAAWDAMDHILDQVCDLFFQQYPCTSYVSDFSEKAAFQKVGL